MHKRWELHAGAVCIGALFFLTVGSFEETAFAGPKSNIRIGALEFHPVAGVRETYDSNIYLEDKGRDEDWITDLGVGTNVSMRLLPERGDRYLLNGSYLANYFWYAKNEERDRLDHRASADFKAEFAQDWTWTVNDSYLRTADPPNNELTALEKRHHNALNTALSYVRERLRWDHGYGLTTDKYDSLSNLDHHDHRYTTTLFYQLFPKTSVLAEFNVGKILYGESATNSDSEYYQIRGGLEGAYWPKITGTFKIGYKNADYRREGYEDFSGLTVFGNIKYDATQRTVVNVYGERSSEESSYEDNSHFELNRIGFRLEHLLTERLTGEAGAYYDLNRYPVETTEDGVTDKREDDVVGFRTGLKYDLTEDIILSADYDLRFRDSVFETYDYTDNKVSAGAKLVF